MNHNTPYTYLLIHKNSGMFYYGLRFANYLAPEDDLGKCYFTSSKTIQKIIEIEGVDAFDWNIRRKFDNKDAAILWEYKVVRRIFRHEKCLNKQPSPKNVPGNWFTNGTDNILGKYCPEGYVPGRTHIETKAHRYAYIKSKSRKWWTDGFTEIHAPYPLNDSFKSGRLNIPFNGKNNGKHLKNTLWWNNGYINYRGIIPPDENFKLGRLKFSSRKVIIKHSEDRKRNQSEKIKGRKHWNNGVQSKLSFTRPGDGWTLGRLFKQKKEK